MANILQSLKLNEILCNSKFDSALDRRFGILYKRLLMGAIAQRSIATLLAVTEPILLVLFRGEWKRFQGDLVVFYSMRTIAERLSGEQRETNSIS